MAVCATACVSACDVGITCGRMLMLMLMPVPVPVPVRMSMQVHLLRFAQARYHHCTCMVARAGASPSAHGRAYLRLRWDVRCMLVRALVRARQ